MRLRNLTADGRGMANRGAWGFFAAMLFSSLPLLRPLYAATPTTLPASSALEARLSDLRHASIQQTGRGVLVQQYEEFILQAGNDPAAAEAMIDLGGVWESRIDGKQINPDPVQAMKWFRRAALAASPESPAYVQARFCIVWRVEFSDPDEARRLLQEIASQSEHQPVVAAQVSTTLIGIAVHEGKLEEAEEHARMVLSQYKSLSDDTLKEKLDGLVASAADTIVDAWTPAALSYAERTARIQKLMSDYPGISAVQSAGADGLRELQHPPQAQTN